MKAPTIIRFLASVCLLISVLVAQPCFADDEGTTILTGKVTTTVTRSPHLQFNGIVSEVLVTPGQHVQVGQPVLRYVLQDEARRNLQREVNMGASVEGQKAQILDLQRQLASVQAQRNVARSLAAKGLGSNQASDRLNEDVRSLNERIILSKEVIAKAQSNFDMRLKELSEYFCTPIEEGAPLPEFLYLTSPIEGYVLSVDASTNPGALFNAGYAPILIGQMNPMLIQVPVYEAELSTIQVGDKAVVEIPSLGDKAFEATVTEIAWVSNDMNVAQASYFNVELTIPNPSLELKPGFKAVVRFN